MDDTLPALVFALGGLGRLAFGDALSGAPEPSLGFAAAQVLFDEEPIGAELSVSRAFAGGALAPVVGASLADDGAAWVGGGLRWTLGSDRVWIESTLMPGLHAQGNGPDLGSVVQFRSSLGLVYAFESGATVAITVDHRSNGGFASLNPGLETLGVRWSRPLD